MRYFFKFLIPLVLFLNGCTSFGPAVLQRDRYSYNLAVAYSGQQELLLNLVRLRYDESPMVLKVGNISGSKNMNGSANVFSNWNWPVQSGNSSVTGNVGYSDNPIYSFTPLEDGTFTSQFLQSMDLSDIAFLIQSGWSIPRVFRVTLQQAGTSVNATSAARPTSSHVPEYQNFVNMVYVLRRMQIEDALSVFYNKTGDTEELTFVIRDGYKITAKEMATLQRAGIPIRGNRIVFSNEPSPGKAYLVTRSMLGILNYLSKGVIVPPYDQKRGVVTLTKYKDGKIFDWQLVLRGMMKICWSAKRPVNSSVAIFYRGYWFYIQDTDSDSKQTFSMLTNLSGLISTVPAESQKPVGLARIV